MHLIPFHRVNSKAVPSYKEIESDAKEMREMANGQFFGVHAKAYALHHGQVARAPYHFFVVSRSGEQYFPSWVIINPKIVNKHPNTRYTIAEGCMSFPFRQTTKVSRFDKIDVEFEVPIPFSEGFRTVKKTLDGVGAEIFQHEVDHGFGRSIYS